MLRFGAKRSLRVFRSVCTTRIYLYSTGVTTVSADDGDVLSVYSINAVAADQFENFIKSYNKTYNDASEKLMRFGIFLKNLEGAAYENKENEHADFGISQFSDLTSEEFIQFHTCYKKIEGAYGSCSISTHTADIEVGHSFDWREKGVVSRVGNQGCCGSCWAFSVIGNVESINAIKTNNLQELSVQQLVDCDSSNYGCRGGFPEQALNYLKEKGSMSAYDYAYTAQDGKCTYDPSKVAVKIENCAVVRVQENFLAQKLKEIGPLSIAIDARSLKRYVNGILSGNSCMGLELNHAVLLVGYDIDYRSGKHYWLVKNSWGENWGEQGYFRMEKGINCLIFMTGDIVTAV